MKRIMMGAVLALAFAFACGKPAEPTQPSAPLPARPAEPAAPAEPATPTARPVPEDLPIAEDFEAETEARITRKTYKKYLAALDREIERDSAR